MIGYNINNKKGGLQMNGLFIRSMEEKIPLDMIYLANNKEITQRKLIIKEVNDEYIYAYCLLRKQFRSFKRENILSIMPISETHSMNHYLH
jgi:predicted DNA-binding transcriptional regulator YafY